mmetsp:Transcript_48510/g.113561  ORF Transcript_48510/g.113561 Transcript_48510/m.113561 type:complete len:413 (+) Transcript_48510:50-1288(+)
MFAAAIVAGQNARRAREFGSVGPVLPMGRRSFASAKADPNHMPMSMLAVFSCISLTLIIAGLYFLVDSAVGKREELVLEYNAVVEDWVSSGRQIFENLQIAAHATALQAGQQVNISEELLPNDTVDELRDSSGDRDLATYSALVYRKWNVRPDFFPQLMDTPTWLSKNDARKEPLVSLGIHVQRTFQDQTDLVTEYTEVENIHKRRPPTPGPPAQKCQELSGEWTKGVCLVTRRLTGICVQVAEKDGLWKLAPRDPGNNQSYGCHFLKGEWHWAKYEVVPPPRTHGRSHGHKQPGPLVIEVRSATDPYLAALELTGGSLDFGMSASDDRAQGICLIFFGLLLAVPPACKLVLSLRAPSEPQSYYTHQEDDECGVTVINSNEWDSVGGHQLGQTRPVGMQMREWSSRSSANHW